MKALRLALAQIDFPIGDVAGNTERIIALLAESHDRHGAKVFFSRARRQRPITDAYHLEV
jgi:hypothetical protein